MAKQGSRPWMWGPDPEFTPTEKTSKPLSGMEWLQREEDRIKATPVDDEIKKTSTKALNTGETTEVHPNLHWYEKYLPSIVVQTLFHHDRQI